MLLSRAGLTKERSMGHVIFPEYVETFIEATNRYLGTFDVKLEEVSQNPKSEGRLYRISGKGDPIELLVHRTSRSSKRPIGEYRARVNAIIRPELANHLRGFKDRANVYATLGALVSSNVDDSVACQCLIQPGSQDTVAGVLAAAAAHARASIVVALRRALGQDLPRAVAQPSAWTDLDFEQLQHDYPDLGIRKVNTRYWIVPLLPYGMLTLSAVDDDPYWGGGLLCMSQIPEKALALDDSKVDVNELNMLANLVDDTPTFGAWCRDGDVVLFLQSIPNLLKSLPLVTEQMIAWALRRAASARKLVEMARETQQRDDG
jgi:hypothetical protein